MFKKLVEHQSPQGRASESKLHSILGSWTFVSGVFIFLLAYLWYGSNKGMQLYDEGLACVGAETVLRGGLIYRDFWTAYGPGQYYLLAGAFRVFGTTLLVARDYTVIAEWAVCIFTYLIARKLAGSLGALASCVTVAIWLNFDREVLYPVIPALAFTLAGFLVFFYRPSNLKLNFVSGILLGCAILIRHDLGIYAIASLFVVFVSEELFGNFSMAAKSLRGFAHAIVPCAALLIGVAVVVLPVLLALLSAMPRALLYEAFIDFPRRIYPQFRSVPVSTEFVRFASSGGLRDRAYEFIDAMVPPLMFLLPLFVFCMTWIFVGMNWRKKERPLREPWLAAGLSLFGFGLYYSVKVRPDHFHMVAAVAVSLILFPWLFQTTKATVSTGWVSLSVRLALLFCVVILSLKGLKEKKRAFQDHDWIQIAGVDRARGILIPREEATSGLTEAIGYIQQNSAPDQFIFVGDRRHDLILMNDAMFYFLSDRVPATRYSDLNPGIATTMNVQSEIIDDLKRHDVGYVVLCTLPKSSEPNRSSESSGVTNLDDFVRTDYKSVADFGMYSILQRSGAILSAGD